MYYKDMLVKASGMFIKIINRIFGIFYTASMILNIIKEITDIVRKEMFGFGCC